MDFVFRYNFLSLRHQFKINRIMKKIYVFSSIIAFSLIHAQVGINTDDPKATFDVNGNVMIRTVDTATPSSSYDFLVRDNATNEVQKVPGNFSTGAVNASLVKVEDRNGITLIDGTMFAGWEKIDFSPASVKIDDGNNFTVSNDFYTVPTSGIYEISYEFRYGTGVVVSALNFSGTESIGILKHNGGNYTVLDERRFAGASIPVVTSIIISDTSINSVYRLAAGDQLSFEVNRGGLNLTLLNRSFASVNIRKIAD